MQPDKSMPLPAPRQLPTPILKAIFDFGGAQLDVGLSRDGDLAELQQIAERAKQRLETAISDALRKAARSAGEEQ
jgi:hypothetical protein